ncbi:LuxR C-terminal-related transcriptional regulator [Rhizobiaceae bacterium BDR2-2]|uniref:LuxR C-terminal-related transcriptional regulator n=1 Tax=Ectorhizobium quercum TaxID=2965071 RepID=A0AAE3MYQ2_9HYPH|nr:LuxR C-terminal-related transcriptional regulator [Ectorhizobium quercum]MCX8996090.1 LuxR C-terminal-related transcriptional regulator [Ectorhizobium quercum]
MAQFPDAVTLAASDAGASQIKRVSSRSDLFPQFVAMQKKLKARNFAVFRLAGGGLPNRRKLVCELENFGAGAAEICNRFIDTYGPALLDHLDKSLLPMMWSGSGEACFAEAPEFASLTVRLPAGVLPFSGIAFPVRLGTTGNGYVVFTATAFDLASDDIIDQHVGSCRLMTDLLALDERRVAHAETLSERELACLQLAGDGRISDEIAEKLGLSVHTVNAYLGSAAIKLDSVNRIQAIAKAIRLGYIH